MSGPNLADTVVEYLISQNVRHIFGVLAHTLFPFGDAIAKHPQLRFINAQHEGGAGNMALGYARATKQPAVCLVSAGGGATNIVTAVAQAYRAWLRLRGDSGSGVHVVAHAEAAAEVAN